MGAHFRVYLYIYLRITANVFGVPSRFQRAPDIGSVGKSHSSHTLPVAAQKVPKTRTMSCAIEDIPMSKGRILCMVS